MHIYVIFVPIFCTKIFSLFLDRSWKNKLYPELLATTSLGHIIGAGVILGLSNAGVL